MTADITRLFPDRDTRYHALVRQQGRLSIDAEENFASDIAEWEREDAFSETIAPSGSPDDGFRISGVTTAGATDFTIGAGSFYLGGARIENPTPLSYRNQSGRNWLGFPLDAAGTAEAIGTAPRFFVWLDGRDHTVTATEDGELRDPGLGGADGVAARRFGWRVRATAVAGPTCLEARGQWLTSMGWSGRVDAASGALRSGASLSVAFDPAEVDQDLCAPALTPGFLGARNECYRVMVSRPGHFVWGRDDAAPLYRVRVESVGTQQRRVVFLTQPRDEHLMPRQGQTVELLRWDERLPNGQKTAEPLGSFYTVASGLADGAITLTRDVDAPVLSWLSGLSTTLLSPEDPPGEDRYFYLRLWTGGGSGAQADIPLANGILGGTGLSLTFAANTLPGDHWVISARPNAPTQLLPWAMRTGMPPHGPRRHVVPLAFVDLAAGTVIDCRRRFRPLYRLGGCCTVTVGNNETSWGDVSTIAEAIARLPMAGGEICLGPGIWREAITLTGLSNITFRGCGARTRWLASADPSEPLVTLNQCAHIEFRGLRMESASAPCLRAGLDASGAGSRSLRLEDCELVTPSGGVVRLEGMRGLAIERCRISSGPLPDPLAANAAFAALTLQGEGLLVRDCQILSQGGATAQALSLGGIHIAGQSRNILIEDNTIGDGAGNGITLGSVTVLQIPITAFNADPDAAIDHAVRSMGGRVATTGFTVSIDQAGCIRLEEQDPDPSDPGGGMVALPISDGNLSQIQISRNRIRRCGANGIATYPLLPINAQGQAAYDAIALERVLIEDNDISGNLLREAAPIPQLQRLFAGLGGITLSLVTDLTIRQNRIEANGLTPARAASGIFVGYGEDVRIENNRIERNGGRIGDSTTSLGGIVVRMAMGGAQPALAFSPQTADPPALRVQDNTVYAPAGRALKAMGQGPMIVTGNRLTGANRSSLFANPLEAFILFVLGVQSAQELFNNPASTQPSDLQFFDAALDFMGGDAVSLVNLSYAEEALLAYTISRLSKVGTINEVSSGAGAVNRVQTGPNLNLFRGGETLFNTNQVSLRRGANQVTGHVSSILIISLDDISCADNQIEIEADATFSLVDTVLVGTSLRATGNRLQDPIYCFYSLATHGIYMNSTAMNQSTFPVSASAGTSKLVDTSNLTFF
jgi:hypothetical protein